MADGSSEDRTVFKQMDEFTFTATTSGLGDTKKCREQSVDRDKVKLSFYTELESSNPCGKSDESSVVGCSTASAHDDFQKPSEFSSENAEDRKKRCFDRYDSSESSDSGVAVLSPTESSACSDITEPASPESGCSSASESARMPPWASEAGPAPRRPPAPPAPRPAALHRRITEYFNHKMKPHNSIKRDCTAAADDDTKRKCLPKNNVSHDLEKYISYLSQTLNPKLLDVGKQPDSTSRKPMHVTFNGVADSSKKVDVGKHINGALDNKAKETNSHSALNSFVDFRYGHESKLSSNLINGAVDTKKTNSKLIDLSANVVVDPKKQLENLKRKIPLTPPGEVKYGMRIEATSSKKIASMPTPDSTKLNGVVSSTTTLDSRMNGVTCGSNNISLNTASSNSLLVKKDPIKKTMQPTKRTNRKSSACIANSKNMTWSKANNLKQQVHLQKQQNCANSTQSQVTPIQNIPGEANTAPKMNIPNGVRQVPMTLNGNLTNLNVPVNNPQNYHQLNIPSPYNGTVTSTNLASFVAVPQNVMLTTLRIPTNGINAAHQALNQQNNLSAFKQNVNVNNSAKLNGQFVFPLMQNINGTVVQIPNLMTKMPNFVLPQQAMAQRQDHLHNQQTTQFLINGTILKLSNTIPAPYPNSNVKPNTVPNQTLPAMNKHIPSGQPMGVNMQTKPNYAMNLSHPMLVPQPGFIVTSVPNVNVKETWSYNLNTNSATSTQQSQCSNPIVHHPPPVVASFTTQHLNSSSNMPPAPLKPPDNPIQGTDPPSSTVKEPELADNTNTKCDMPWLSKTINNNVVSIDSIKNPTRPFAHVSLSYKVNNLITEKTSQDGQLETTDEFRTGVECSQKELNKSDVIERTEDAMFTEILVKDVTSNVSNTVIEANFCSTPTESSESGIGTDKSIDSPSDSQASKECDDDSSLSLSVSVCSVDAQSSQKSPILKQPKTLRFPPRNSTKTDGTRKSSTDTTSTVTLCLWENCTQEFESDTDLLGHLQSVHVESQVGRENYVCLWARCKVRGKPSCSRLWLERHALSHGGNKPFKCIVDACDKRFSTQTLLERHVNNHFSETSPSAGSGKKASDSASKLIRRNGKKLRYRRQPWSARMFDYFDAGVMEGLSWRLALAARWRGGGACPYRDPGAHALTLHAAPAARRRHAGRAELLLTYYPPHIVEDEWVPEDSAQRTRHVEIASLPPHKKVLLYEMFCDSYRRRPLPAPPAPAAAPRARSTRLLNNLLTKKTETSGCPATNQPVLFQDEDPPPQVSGAKKRKMGRKYGGNSFWPCGR